MDTAVLARLRTNPHLNVYDGLVLAPKDPAHPVVVEVPLPYINYTSAVGLDDNPRLTGRNQRRSVPFYLTYVGVTREQCKAAGEAARQLLEGWLPVIEGVVTWRAKCEVSQQVRRNDDAVRDDGKPLYSGFDQYAVSIQPSYVPAT